MKLLIYAILFMFIASYIFPQQDLLTLDQLEHYLDSQIIIVDYVKSVEVEPQSHSTLWKTYQNGEPLSERKFFSITGNDLQAQQVTKHKLESIPLIAASPVVCYFGISLTKTVAEWEHKEGSDGDLTIMIFVATLALSIHLLSSGVRRLTNNRYQYSQAEVVMHEYNEKLLEESRQE
jgi:hypothetical protein